MDTFFKWFGYVSFAFICFAIGYHLYHHLDWYNYRREFYDKNYLNNLGWTQEEHDKWMEESRKSMTNEEYKSWAKKNVRFYYSYINLNFSKRKVPKK